MFVTTANTLDTIPGPLRDRMEVIQLAGYTEEEKLEIAKRYLVPRQIERNGLTPSQIAFSDAGAAERSSPTTRARPACASSNARSGRSCARSRARSPRASSSARSRSPSRASASCSASAGSSPRRAGARRGPGVATGLAWTPVGGEVLFIEATAMPGKGRLTITGQLGDVMQESAQAALSYIRSNASEVVPDLAADWFATHDIHIHVPAGATPKDGPSAGVAMVTALASLLTGRPVRSDVAMTGEITLTGQVLPIGGLKEKALAAQRNKIRCVIAPALNEQDVDEIPEHLRKDLEFTFVSTIDEVLEVALQRRAAPQRRTAPQDPVAARRRRPRGRLEPVGVPLAPFTGSPGQRARIAYPGLARAHAPREIHAIKT